MSKIGKAKYMLWHREARNEKSNKRYSNPENPTQNKVVVGEQSGLGGIDVVLYRSKYLFPNSKKII